MSPQDAFIVDSLVAHFCAPGAAFGGDDPGLHWPRIAFEWELGQHIWLFDEHDDVSAWAAWWRVDDDVIKAIERGEQDDWIREQVFPVLWDGPHCYLSDAVVFPGAPRSTYRAIIERVGEMNSDASTLSATLTKRDGRQRWAMRVNDGSPFWWRRCQSAWRHLH